MRAPSAGPIVCAALAARRAAKISAGVLGSATVDLLSVWQQFSAIGASCRPANVGECRRLSRHGGKAGSTRCIRRSGRAEIPHGNPRPAYRAPRRASARSCPPHHSTHERATGGVGELAEQHEALGGTRLLDLFVHFFLGDVTLPAILVTGGHHKRTAMSNNGLRNSSRTAVTMYGPHKFGLLLRIQ